MAEINVSALLQSGSVIPYDQSEVEAVMRKILYQNGISDVLYDGSNISQLTSVVSYVISTLNINTAINLQETILPLATKRMNALFGARQLGYEPYTKNAYKYILTITPEYDLTKVDVNGTLNTLDQTKRKIDLVRNTVFVSGNKTYYYKGPTINGIFNFSNFDIQNKSNPEGDGSYEDFFKEIEVTEGTLITSSQDASLVFTARDYVDDDGILTVKQDFIIPHHDIEDDGIQVFIETSDYSVPAINGVPSKKLIERTKSKHFLIDETFTYDKNKFVRQENIILQYPVIFFEYSGMGQPLQSGDKVYVNIFKTTGADGISDGPFIPENSTIKTQFKISDARLFKSGTSEESMSSIKRNATIFNNTANRAVSKLDYIAISKRHSLVKESEVWGGEEETPAQLGNIWLSTIPNYKKEYLFTSSSNTNLAEYRLAIGTPSDLDGLNNWYQSSDNITQLTEYLDFYKIMTMQLHHRHPLYINFDFIVDIVKYDMTKAKTTVDASVFNAINSYFTDNIEKYDAEYLNSNLQRNLDTVLSHQSGIGYEIGISGMIFKNMKDTFSNNKIYATLAFPFEDIFVDAGTVDHTLLPSIDTIEFGVGSGTLYVDYTLLTSMTISENTKTTNIIYGGTKNQTTGIVTGGEIIGTYTINRLNSVIELEFSLEDSTIGGLVAEDIIFGAGSGSYAEFNIHYPYSNVYNQNIPFTKYTMPRLRSVKFKDN